MSSRLTQAIVEPATTAIGSGENPELSIMILASSAATAIPPINTVIPMKTMPRSGLRGVGPAIPGFQCMMTALTEPETRRLLPCEWRRNPGSTRISGRADRHHSIGRSLCSSLIGWNSGLVSGPVLEDEYSRASDFVSHIIVVVMFGWNVGWYFRTARSTEGLARPPSNDGPRAEPLTRIAGMSFSTSDYESRRTWAPKLPAIAV
jgi:hypothetical protein